MDFGQVFVRTVWVLVPLSVIAIPLLGVIGKVIVKPITNAIGRLADVEREAMTNGLERKFAELDERLSRIERQLARVLADTEARRQLETGVAASSIPPIPRDTEPLFVGQQPEVARR